MDLAGFHACPVTVDRNDVASGPVLEGVAGFMGDDLDIALGPVEIREDKGRVIRGQLRAVAAGLLAGRGDEIHHLVLEHVVDELRGLR